MVEFKLYTREIPRLVPDLVSVRAQELFEGGAVADFLLRSYLEDQTKQGLKTKTRAVHAEDLHSWYKLKTKARRKIAKLFMKISDKNSSSPKRSRKRDEPDEEEDGEDDAKNPFDQFILACFDRLSCAIDKQVHEFRTGESAAP